MCARMTSLYAIFVILASVVPNVFTQYEGYDYTYGDDSQGGPPGGPAPQPPPGSHGNNPGAYPGYNQGNPGPAGNPGYFNQGNPGAQPPPDGQPYPPGGDGGNLPAGTPPPGYPDNVGPGYGNYENPQGGNPGSAIAPGSPWHSQQGPPAVCDVQPVDADLIIRVSRLIERGVKMIHYNLTFPEYVYNPMVTNASYSFQTTDWRRVTSHRNSVLLALAFNFDVLSCTLLSHGVEQVTVELLDSPAGCLAQVDESRREVAVRRLLMADMDVMSAQSRPADLGAPHWVEDEDYLCHRVIEVDEDEQASFGVECCTVVQSTLQENHQKVRCVRDFSNQWMDCLGVLLIILKLMLLCFGPLFVQKLLFRDSMLKADYIVPVETLGNSLRKSMLVKKVLVVDDTLMSRTNQQKEIKHFRKFRKLVRNIPSDEIVHVNFRKLHVTVDHKELISEKRAPVGILKFLYEQILRCGICRTEPWASCCRQSIFGSWGPKFLWFNLCKGSDCNKSCQKFMSWGHLTRLIGFFVVMAVVPLPYYIRMICFYEYEEPEVTARQESLDELDLKWKPDHNLYQYLTPTHAGLCALYGVYMASFVLLGLIRHCDREKVENIIYEAISDMRHISCLECVRMLLAHLLLPFEKFGLCGFVLAALYWPIALPVSCLVFVWYCIPTLYLTGRFIIHRRPEFLRRKPHPRPINKPKQTSLSDGTTSFESWLLLENISPSGSHRNPHGEGDPGKHPGDSAGCGVSRHQLSSAVFSLLVGFLCILLMLSVLLMYAEALVFLLEILILTIVGAIANASHAASYVVFAGWTAVYVLYCFSHMYRKYQRLNHTLFKYLKDKLEEQVQHSAVLRHEKRKNTAFKYFSDRDVEEHRRQVAMYIDSDDDAPASGEKRAKKKNEKGKLASNNTNHQDTIDYLNNRLHWSVHSLVLFIDSRDVPRIPEALFHRACAVDAPGCPGPIHLSIYVTLKKLIVLLVFLVIFFFIIMIVGDLNNVTTSTELLLTVIAGSLPLFVLLLLDWKKGPTELNTFSFKGVIHQLMMDFKQTWPVYDLSFTRDYLLESNGTTVVGGAGARPYPTPDVLDPTHVDLLITVKDECDEVGGGGTDNFRSERAAFGSRVSLNSNNSPEEFTLGNSTSHLPPYTRRQVYTDNPVPVSPLVGGNGISPKQRNPPSRVDLVVDLAKGGVQVRRDVTQAGTQTETGKGGIPMRSLPQEGAGDAAGPEPDSESEV